MSPPTSHPQLTLVASVGNSEYLTSSSYYCGTPRSRSRALPDASAHASVLPFPQIEEEVAAHRSPHPTTPVVSRPLEMHTTLITHGLRDWQRNRRPRRRRADELHAFLRL